MDKVFSIGSRVKIIFGTYNLDGAEGNFGTIIKKGVQNYDWIVRVEFPGTQSDDLGFNSDELELIEEETEEAIPVSANPAPDISITEIYSRGWNAAILSVLDIINRISENPVSAAAIFELKTVIEDMHQEYAKKEPKT